MEDVGVYCLYCVLLVERRIGFLGFIRLGDLCICVLDCVCSEVVGRFGFVGGRVRGVGGRWSGVV